MVDFIRQTSDITSKEDLLIAATNIVATLAQSMKVSKNQHRGHPGSEHEGQYTNIVATLAQSMKVSTPTSWSHWLGA